MNGVSSTTHSTGQPDSAPMGVNELKDRAAEAGQQIQERAAGLKDASAGLIKEQAGKAMEAAQGMAAQAGEALESKIDDQKNVSADYAKDLAGTLRRAAGEFDSKIPIAAQYIRTAADQVDSVSDAVRNGNVSDLVKGAQDFARRQPTAFLGLTVLAGFGLVRFLKSSGSMTSTSSSSQRDTGAS